MADRSITDVFAWEALDSRGKPTVGVRVEAGGASGRVIVPSGASTGRHEAVELRDGGDRYAGQGVQRAVEHVRTLIRPALLGRDVSEQAAIDRVLEQLDDDPALSRVGANAVLGASLGCLIAAASASGLPLWRRLGGDIPLIPMPMVNIVSGGAHARGLLDIQDVLVIPVGAGSFAEAIEWVSRIRVAAAALLDAHGATSALVADEGGLAGALGTNRAALELVTRAIERAGFAPGDDAALALDIAANQLFADGGYHLRVEGAVLTAEELLGIVAEWTESFPIASLEDVLAEDDWAGWAQATTLLGERRQLLGDDLFATNGARLERGVADGVANAVLIKPNQAGTVSRTAAVVAAARAASYRAVVSARSGDTEDTWLADLAIGWGAGQIKVGSTTRSERTAKWNRVLEIEAGAGGHARFAGWEGRS